MHCRHEVQLDACRIGSINAVNKKKNCGRVVTNLPQEELLVLLCH